MLTLIRQIFLRFMGQGLFVNAPHIDAFANAQIKEILPVGILLALGGLRGIVASPIQIVLQGKPGI